MFRMIDLIAERKLDAVTFTSAPAVAALMDAAGSDRPPRRGRRRLPGRRGRGLRRAGDRRGLRAVGRADDPPRALPARRRWSSSWRPSCRSRRAGLTPRGGRPPAAAARRRRARSTASRSGCPRRRCAVLQALAREPRPRGLPARAAGRAALPAPPAPSTPSRWPSPGCAPRSAPALVQTVVKRGYRLAHEHHAVVTGRAPTVTPAGHRRARDPGAGRQPGRRWRSPPRPGAGSASRRGAYVELCTPLFSSVVRSLERAVGGGPAAALHRLPRPPRPARGDAARVRARAGGPPARSAPAAGRGDVPAAARVRCPGRGPGGAGRRGLPRPRRGDRPRLGGRMLQARWGSPVPGRHGRRGRTRGRRPGRGRAHPRPGGRGALPARRGPRLAPGRAARPPAGATSVADVLGPHPLVVELVVRRYRALAAARAVTTAA